MLEKLQVLRSAFILIKIQRPNPALQVKVCLQQVGNRLQLQQVVTVDWQLIL
jgi:hypothetical protein